jgi:hypothetical protein
VKDSLAKVMALVLLAVATAAVVASDFERLLARDVTAYLSDDGSVLHRVSLLQRLPTQTGVGDPKYYVWILASDADGSDISGAARVADDGDRFHVLQYFPCEELREGSQRAAKIFPDESLPVIAERVAETCPMSRSGIGSR